jgi:hypothetical protein
MAKYFFPVRCENLSIDDERGQQFSTLDDARAHTAIIAGQLAQDGKAYQGCAVCVLDEIGEELAKVPIDAE